MTKNTQSVFEQIIDHFGGRAALAKALGISKQAVSGWGGIIPATRAYQIESLTNHKFDASQIINASNKEAAA